MIVKLKAEARDRNPAKDRKITKLFQKYNTKLESLFLEKDIPVMITDLEGHLSQEIVFIGNCHTWKIQT